jgi:hypothetical protein
VPEPELSLAEWEEIWEVKYAEHSPHELIAARAELSKQINLLCQRLMTERIKHGDCETLIQSIGENIAPKTPRGWSHQVNVAPQLDGTEIVKIAMMDPDAHPETMLLRQETRWLDFKIHPEHIPPPRNKGAQGSEGPGGG